MTTAATEPAHQVDILHQRQRAVTADLGVKPLGDQQPLVAVRQPQCSAAKRHQPLQHARSRAHIVERKAESRGGDRPRTAIDTLHELIGLALPAGGQSGVGVQKQQPGEARPCRAGRQLTAAPRRR